VSEFSSVYLATRLTVLASRLISFEQLVDFIELDLEQVMSRLKQHGGHEYDIEASNPRSIEAQLSNRALDDFQILMRPFAGSERRFFQFAIRWFELVNLKVMIRGKFSGVDSRSIEDQLIDLRAFTDLPIARLLDTDDPYEMLRLLETTAYGGIVRQARRVYEEFEASCALSARPGRGQHQACPWQPAGSLQPVMATALSLRIRIVAGQILLPFDDYRQPPAFCRTDAPRQNG
jgi:vacuolar-type H+-ATPase subunit C/Vma6